MKTLLLVLCVGLLIGCQAKVGDPCSNNLDCVGSSGPNLKCDPLQPEGYCTLSPCDVNECPSEAVCVLFPDDTTFCMKRCDDNKDCRSDYVCVANYGDAPFCNAEPYADPLE